ncbi:MAG: hypothetical protein WA209_03775, partial [Candidatus Acidiferrales bacterium]
STARLYAARSGMRLAGHRIIAAATVSMRGTLSHDYKNPYECVQKNRTVASRDETVMKIAGRGEIALGL